MMSKTWAEKNGAVNPAPASAPTPGYAALNANGTGPFILESHQPGIKTIWRANPNWWSRREHNLDEAIFTPIGSGPTRVAALLSGEIDMMDPVPPQDIPRVDASPIARVLTGPELRTIFLGMDQRRDELLYSNVKGRNPFKDVRVRQAFAKAIDLHLIRDRVMRGLSEPAALLISPLLFAGAKDFRPATVDVEGAKKLLVEAGYPQGFAVGLDCPNDRYVNDEAICQAVVGMLARIGVKVSLNAQPKTKFSPRCWQAAATTPRSIYSAGCRTPMIHGTYLPTSPVAGTRTGPEGPTIWAATAIRRSTRSPPESLSKPTEASATP